MSEPAAISILAISVAGLFAFSWFLLEIWKHKERERQWIEKHRNHGRKQSKKQTAPSVRSSVQPPRTTQAERNASRAAQDNRGK